MWWSPLAVVRPGERRDVAGAILAIFLVLLGHSVLETARDALYLTYLPTTNLPWVYLAVAGLGLAGTRVSIRSPGALRDRRVPGVLLLGAALGTAAFWWLASASGAWVFYALYVWAGVASTVVLVRFWLLLSERFTASQAKRIFPVVSAGGIAGALGGYALAGVAGWSLPARDLIAMSSALQLLGAASLWVMSPRGGRVDAAEGPDPGHRPRMRDTAGMTAGSPYARRVGLLLLVASVTVTVGDFLFKSAVAREIPDESLSAFFASAYFGFNVLSLVALPFVGMVVRRLGVTGALAVLPVLLLAGSFAYGGLASLAAVLALRGADGALRFSFHKTTTELLYVPMPTRLRAAVKGVVDVLAHRGGQAIASIVILGWLAAFESFSAIWVVIAVGAVAWIALARSLREPYLDLFRRTLREGSIPTRLDFPELDLASLETLIAALNSPDDAKVLAAMELLDETERASLIPALILYHPSARVVARALDLFAAARREDVLPMIDRLLDHEDAEVRAAALRSRAALAPSRDVLRASREHWCPAVDATAVVALTARGWMRAEEGLAVLGRLFEEGKGEDPCSVVRPFLARAIRYQPSPLFVNLLDRLARAPELETRLEAVRAMRAAADREHLPILVSLLSEQRLRVEVRRAFLAIGEPALEHLARALDDRRLPRSVRVHLPRSLSPFGSARAADVLLRHLLVEPSGMVRYKILRGLGRMVAEDPRLPLDGSLLDRAIERTVVRILELVHWRDVLEEGAPEGSPRRTVGLELLTTLLRDKERHAIERLFRTLGLRYRREDLAQIYRGLAEGGSRARSSGRELLEVLLPARLGRAVLGLIDDLPAEARLEAGASYHDPDARDYESVLAELVRHPSETVSTIAEYHAGEIGLDVRLVGGDGAPAEVGDRPGEGSALAEIFGARVRVGGEGISGP